MNSQERENLKKEYQYLPDDEIIELFRCDKDEFEEGVFGIVEEEFKRRDLQKKIDEMEELEGLHQQPNQENIVTEWAVVIETFANRIEAEHAQSLLEEQGIESTIQDDDAGFKPHLALTGASVSLIIAQKDTQKAKEALNVLKRDS